MDATTLSQTGKYLYWCGEEFFVRRTFTVQTPSETADLFLSWTILQQSRLSQVKPVPQRVAALVRSEQWKWTVEKKTVPILNLFQVSKLNLNLPRFKVRKVWLVEVECELLFDYIIINNRCVNNGLFIVAKDFEKWHVVVLLWVVFQRISFLRWSLREIRRRVWFREFWLKKLIKMLGIHVVV